MHCFLDQRTWLGSALNVTHHRNMSSMLARDRSDKTSVFGHKPNLKSRESTVAYFSTHPPTPHNMREILQETSQNTTTRPPWRSMWPRWPTRSTTSTSISFTRTATVCIKRRVFVWYNHCDRSILSRVFSSDLLLFICSSHKELSVQFLGS